MQRLRGHSHAGTRGTFGYHGAKLPAIINLVILIGFLWIVCRIEALSIDYVVNELTGFSNVAVWVTVVGIAITAITIWGHVFIEWFSRIAAVVMMALVVAMFVKIFSTFDLSALSSYEVDPSVHGTTWVVAFDLMVGAAISWAPIAADYNRNCPTAMTSVIGTGSGYVVAALAAIGLGSVVAVYSFLETGERIYDPAMLLADQGFGIPAAIAVLLSVLTTQSLTLYSATFSFIALRPKTTFWKAAGIIGLIGILGAYWSGILEEYNTFVLTIGTVFMPMFGILIVDFYIFKHRDYSGLYDSSRKGRFWYFGGFNVSALAVYAVSATVAYFMVLWKPVPAWVPLSGTANDLLTGVAEKFGGTVPALLLAAVLYWVVEMIRTRGRATELSRTAFVAGREEEVRTEM